jgi:hypothetical protein
VVTSIQIGVIIVNMVLVVDLSWIDTFYQNTQGIAAVRAQNLEQFLLKKRKLNTQMFVQNGFRHMSWILPAIYSGFLVALFLLGQFAALQQTANDEGDRGNDNNAAFALPSLGCLQSLLCEADYFLGRRRKNCTSHSS